MTCWKWFDEILKEAGLKVTETNKKKIDTVIHQYIGQQAILGHCSSDWKKARKEIQADEKMKKELTEKLKVIV